MISVFFHKTVLIVEDDNITNSLITQMLKKYFKSVISCYSSDEAYTKYLHFKPELIITDIEMPKKNGFELSKMIREDDKSIPIVIMTSHTNQDYLFQALNIQVLYYLVKPIEKENFDEMIEKIQINYEKENKKEFYFNDSVYYDFKKKIIINSLDSSYESLTNNEIDILEELINNKKSILSSEYFEIMFGIENSNALKLNISRLRKKLPQNTIETVYSRGYILNQT